MVRFVIGCQIDGLDGATAGQPALGRQRRCRAGGVIGAVVSAVTGVAVAEPVRVAEAAGLEHVRAVPAEPPPPAVPGAVQRRARAGVPPLPRPVRQDQGASGGILVAWCFWGNFSSLVLLSF